MIKILFASTNQSKVERIRMLINKKIKLTTLREEGFDFPEPEENGRDGEENAKIKAAYYFNKVNQKYPVLSQDDTLFFKKIPSLESPGKDIKKPVVEKYGVSNYENIIKYYSQLALKYGGKIEIEFRYGHAMASTKGVFSKKSKLKGWLVSTPNGKRTETYPLADILIVEVGGEKKYWSELTKKELELLDFDVKRSVNDLISGL